jgi:hypothetical protein
MAILVLVLFASLSCAKWQQDLKHFNSQMIGLKRVVTLYSADGSVIKEWRGNNMRVEHVPGGISFIHNGKVIIISGTFTVEEE